MKLKKLIKNAREISEPYRVTKGEKFRLKDVDPADTGGFSSEEKPRAREMLAAGIQALEHLQDMLGVGGVRSHIPTFLAGCHRSERLPAAT